MTKPIRWGLGGLPPSVIRSLVMGFVTTYLSPDVSMFTNGAILVDADGQLRSDTDEPIPIVTARLGERGGYLVGDRDLYDRYSAQPHHVATAPGLAYAYMPDFKRSRKHIYHEGASIAELAASTGLPADALEQSVEQARAGGRPVALSRPPYFAMGPVRSLLVQTNGGLRVSPSMQVVDEEHRPIKGLYAAGNAGQGGILLMGYGHHLGWAFTSGRIAGRNAARCWA